MKLRNFLYVNNKILEDYVAAIEGYVYDEATLSDTTTSSKNGDGKIGVKCISAGGGISKEEVSTAVKSVKVSDAAKFDKVYSYLNDEDELKYYEMLDEDIFSELRREDFIEVLVSPRFSKMKELTNTVNQLGNLISTFQGLTDQQLLNADTQQKIQGFKALERLNPTDSVTCVFNFEDKKFPLVAKLDNQYFRCEEERFVGEICMLCKVQKKIEKGKSIKLDEIFENFKNMPLNREQKRKMPKNIENPKEFQDVVKGPAITVIPIAIYQ